MNIKVRLTLERETKNTVRYTEAGDDEAVLGTLYVPKPTLRRLHEGEFPSNLLVTLEAGS